MKKSFLITLAAVSSVALIGCSSSSDDNGGSKGPEKKYEYKVSNVLVAPITAVKAEATHLASNVTFTLEKKEQGNAEAVLEPATDEEKANFKIGVICDGDTDGKKAENFVVTTDKIAISKEKAKELASDSCNVEVAGELLPESEAKSAKIDLTEGNYNKGAASVSIDGKGVDNTAKTISLDAAVDTAAVEYTVTATEAGTLTVDEAKKTIEIKDGAAITELTIAGEKLENVFADGDKNNDDKFTLDASKAAAAIKDGKVKVSKSGKIDTSVDYTVTIAKEGDKPSGDTPKVTVLEDTIKTSPAIVVEISNIPAAIQNGSEITCNVFNTDKNVIIPQGKITGGKLLVGAKTSEIAGDDGKDTTKCTIGEAQVDVNFNTAKTAANKNTAVVTLKLANSPVTGDIAADGTEKVVEVTKVKALNSYAENDLTATKTDPSTIANAFATENGSAESAAKFAVGASDGSVATATKQACDLSAEKNTCSFKIKGIANGNGKLVLGGAAVTNKVHEVTVTVSGI